VTGDRHEETIFSFSPEAPQPPDRRRDARHLTILRVGALVAEGGRELCLIRNISAGGIMAHVYCHHRTGERVSVELKSEEPIAGSIIWARDSNIGIAFDTAIDVEEMLASQSLQENGWRPRMPRVEVDRLATIRLGSDVYGVNSCDISQGGVKIECDVPLAVGAQVMIALDKLRPLAGHVRWSRDGFCGIAFNQVVPFRELMAWLRPDAGEARKAS
jgi:hypothetical protein